MVSLRRGGDGVQDEAIAIESAAAHSRGGGRISVMISAVALALSVNSLWERTLKQADLHVFVPPVLQYSAPYQNSNFEMIAIPVTPTNDGAQTGTVLSMELAVTDPRTIATKRAVDHGANAQRQLPAVCADLARRTLEPHGERAVLHARRGGKARPADPQDGHLSLHVEARTGGQRPRQLPRSTVASPAKHADLRARASLL
jgi:hypothetical protein